jgi:hypothetical protein
MPRAFSPPYSATKILNKFQISTIPVRHATQSEHIRYEYSLTKRNVREK